MTDDQRDKYFDELKRLGTPEEVRDYLRRLVALGELGTPEEFRLFMRTMGSTKQEEALRAQLQKMFDTQEFYARIFTGMKTVALWAGAIAAGWLAFKGLLGDFLSGIIK